MTLGLYLHSVGRDVLLVPVAAKGATVVRDPVSRYSETWSFSKAMFSFEWSVFHVGSASVRAELGIVAVNSVLILGGLGLIPLLWQPLSHKGVAVVRTMYAAWLLVVTLLALLGATMFWHVMSEAPSGPPLTTVTVRGPYLLPSVMLFPLGVLLSGAALILMLREPPAALAPVPALRTGWQWAAALTLTVGALLWGIGFYLMPEATTRACPTITFAVTRFARGACAGLDSDQVLRAAYYAGLNPIARLLFRASQHFEALVAVGGITTLGGWTRRLSVGALAWLAAWPALVLGVALVALRGVGVIARHGDWFTAAIGGVWHLGPGMIVTFIGIGLVALGQCGLWYQLLRRNGAASAG